MNMFTAINRRLSSTPRIVKMAGIILIVVVIGFGLSRLRVTQPTTSDYQTTSAEKGTLVVSTSVSGLVASANSASITTNATGVVTSVMAQNGQTVKSGQEIARIELDQVAKQKYTQALASYQSAKTNVEAAKTKLYTLQATMLDAWDSYKELAESDEYKDTSSPNRNLPEFYISQNQWLAAEDTYKQQQAVINQAQSALTSAWLSLQQTSPTIYAPISGQVTGLSLQKGTVITSGSDSNGDATAQKIASITTDALPTVSVSLTEIDVTKVSLGDKVTLSFDALPDKTFTGQIISLDTIGSVSSNVTSYPAVIRLDTKVEGLYSNMSAQASIMTDRKDNVLLVPSSAVQTQNGQATVRVLRNGQPEVVAVTTGLSSDTQTEIIDGLSEGDLVITSTATPVGGASSGATSTSPFSSFGRGFGGTGGTRNVVRIGG